MSRTDRRFEPSVMDMHAKIEKERVNAFLNGMRQIIEQLEATTKLQDVMISSFQALLYDVVNKDPCGVLLSKKDRVYKAGCRVELKERDDGSLALTAVDAPVVVDASAQYPEDV